MVGVQVREQHAVESSDGLRLDRRRDPDQRADVPTQRGIGQEPDPVDLDQNRGMAEPRDRGG